MRSYLFVPASSERLLPKALASGADVVVLDFEDALHASSRALATRLVLAHKEQISARPTDVRIGWSGDDYNLSDLNLAVDAGARAIRLPKAEDPAKISAVCSSLTELSSSVALHLTIESANGLMKVAELAAASPRVERAIFGERDFLADVGIDTPGPLTMHARSHLTIASRAARLGPPIDGAFIDLQDQEGLYQAAALAKTLGFWGKSAIHPSQLPTIHSVFTLGAERIAWAERVCSAYEEAQANSEAVAVVDGLLVDGAVIRRASQILEGRP